METMYEKIYYVMVGKTKICYGMNLDFFELDDMDLCNLSLYENETVRYNGDWFVVKRKSKVFFEQCDRDSFPTNWIKFPWKKQFPVELINHPRP